ncbi:hypothetical protein HAX54_045253 [Datura stramonium]|uniref:Uncharacterized protein n=1 Tax=Datura stramonium TaxID=4076 RepID=A0ABS8RH73_DATST|nr:hypothetical protein [Datura stramonium]
MGSSYGILKIGMWKREARAPGCACSKMLENGAHEIFQKFQRYHDEFFDIVIMPFDVLKNIFGTGSNAGHFDESNT